MDKNQFVRKQVIHKKGIPKVYDAKDKIEIFEKIDKIEKKKTPKEIAFITKTLRNHFVFYALSDNEIESIVPEFFYCEAKNDTFLFKQGEDATCFFIIEKGSAQVIINEQIRRKLQPGDSFGELALLYNAPRSASIKTLEGCSFWAIDRGTFRKVIEDLTNVAYDANRQFIEDIKFFQSLTIDQKDGIASVLTTQKFSKDQNIVSEGDPGSSYYIIKEGTVSVQKGTKEVRKLYRGESFGEQALYYNTARTMTCKAIEDNTICLALGRDMMVKILGDGIQVIILRNTQRWALQKSQLFSKLTKIQIERLLDSIKIFNYKTGDVLIKKGTVGCPKVLLILEGSIKKENDSKSSIGKGGIFGDEYFLEENQSKTITDNVVVEKDASIGEIDKRLFEEAIGGNLNAILKRNETSHEKKTFVQCDKKTQSIGWSLEDFYHLKKLGHGQFGSVYLIKHKELNELFALKCVSKQQIIEQNLEKYLKQERTVCDMVNFPFAMQFIRTYKDDYQIYFLLEYIKGMELFDVIRDIGLLKTYDCQFYIGSMILALEYLHSFNIIYRDIKPENIMIDHNGTLKMIDMGTAKIMKGKTGAGSRTFTIIGTPHYMAPEIIAGKGYNINVDLWSIGVCFYEFMCGMVPFGEECEDPYEIYEEVIKKSLKFPNYVDDKKAKKLMEQLLHKVPEIRLGTSYAALKANPFFGNLDWDKLIEKQLKPPYVPPKEKLLSEKEIEKIASQKKPVIHEIMNDQKNLKPASKLKSKDPTWDKEF